MTAVNAGAHELGGVRLPYAGTHAVFMYSTAADGNVTLQLRDSDDLDRSGLASMLARLQDDATLSISYQDSDILSDGSIDVLLGATSGPLHASGGTEPVTATFDLFDSSSGQELAVSPQTFATTADAFVTDSSDSLQGLPADAADTGLPADEQKKTNVSSGGGTGGGSTASEVVKLTVKRARPKATSPNRQGPQQCQVCAKVFGNASALAKHKLTHSDERKYVCTMCGKAFKRQDHLNGHMLTHRNKKPYECKAEGCGKSYCDARSLRRHTENHHSGGPASAPTSTMSPAQGAAAGDAASPHGASCIQYAPPPAPTAAKSQLQQLLATDPVKGASGGNNDGLTKQQLDLIHQIMEQTQRQAQPATKSPAKTTAKQTSAAKAGKVHRNLNAQSNNSQTTTASKVSTGNAAITVAKSAGGTSGSTSTTSTTTSTGTTSTAASSAVGQQQKPELKPVECNLCHRKFKNIPALNGHMRLHGGYFKKLPERQTVAEKKIILAEKKANLQQQQGQQVLQQDAENKKCEKKESSGPPLQTASVSVRALIEEKIIQKRITNPPAGDSSRSGAPPLYPLTVHSSETDSKVTSFVVPAPPQPPVEKTRRHSDAENFTVPRAPPCQSPALPQDADALGDLILKRSKVAVKRATSDPGQTPNTNQSQQIQLQFQPGDAFALASVTYQSEDGGYFSPSLQDEVFHQVQDTMLLQGVDAQQLASIQFQAASLLQEQDEQLQDIASLEDYATVTASLHDTVVDSTAYQSTGHTVNQELQAVLDSPLPDSLADFSTFHSTNNMPDMSSPNYQTQSPAHQFTNSPHTSLATQSPLQSPLIRNDSPGFAYPTPPASHEGPSPSFTQTSLLPLISPQTTDFTQINTRDPEEPPQASSPLSAAFFTSTMSSAAAVEEALEEVLPGESIAPDDIYPSLSNSPPPQSPISVAMTPVPSPLSSIPTTSSSVSSQSVSSNITFPMSPHYTLQSQMMPNSDDPLLSSSPKDFATRKKFEFNTIQNTQSSVKVIGNGYINFPNQENLTGILVDSNGELKFIQTGGNPIQAKNIIVTGATIAQNTATVMIKQEQDIKFNHVATTHQKIHHKVNKMSHQCVMTPGVGNHRTHSVRPNKLPVDHVKQEEADDVFLSPSIIPASPSRTSRKRPRSEPLNIPHNYQSRLRAARGKPPGSAPYTPLPILNPSRQSSGLFWDAINKTTIGSNIQNNGISDVSTSSDCTPESDSTPHINVGNLYQCSSIPDYQPGKEKDDGQVTEHLLWNPEVNYLCTDNEVDMYLDFACCAAVPGGGRNKEYALHLLHMCGGNIHEAMLKLMQPSPFLPPDHPLLHYQYSDSDQWSAAETEAFHQAINKYDKDFFSIAKDVGTKTVKQCVQFYYIWKKVCTDEYRRLRINREQRQYGTCLSSQDIDVKEEKDIDSKLGITDIDTQMSIVDNRSFTCEFNECSASFNSRAALNGHIRIHGGTVRRSPTPTQGVERRLNALTPTPQQIHHHHHHPLDPADAEYPCKICGKVFSKIKSRSAHMKSHRPPDAEPKRKTEYLPGSYTSDPNNVISSPATHAH